MWDADLFLCIAFAEGNVSVQAFIEHKPLWRNTFDDEVDTKSEEG